MTRSATARASSRPSRPSGTSSGTRASLCTSVRTDRANRTTATGTRIDRPWICRVLRSRELCRPKLIPGLLLASPALVAHSAQVVVRFPPPFRAMSAVSPRAQGVPSVTANALHMIVCLHAVRGRNYRDGLVDPRCPAARPRPDDRPRRAHTDLGAHHCCPSAADYSEPVRRLPAWQAMSAARTAAPSAMP